MDPWGQKELVLPELHELEMPALVVWGTNDIVVPVAHARAAMAALPAARLEILAGCGHMPQVEDPDAFVQALTSFLDDHRLL